MHLALSSNNLLPSEQLTTFHFPRVYVWLVLSNGSANNTYICIHLYLYIRVDFKGVRRKIFENNTCYYLYGYCKIRTNRFWHHIILHLSILFDIDQRMVGYMLFEQCRDKYFVLPRVFSLINMKPKQSFATLILARNCPYLLFLVKLFVANLCVTQNRRGLGL